MASFLLKYLLHRRPSGEITEQDPLEVRVRGLENRLDTLTNGDGHLLTTQASSSLAVSSAPVTGRKTVTSTAAELFAGASRKPNRNRLVVRNLNPAVPIRLGSSGVTDTIGHTLEPGATVEVDLNPVVDTAVFAVSVAGNVTVEVLEV